MLQNIRDNSSGIIAKTIVGLIAITFVVTGVNFFSSGSGENIIAEVGDIEITERYLVSRLERERRQLLQAIGDPAAINENLLRQSVLDTIMDEAQAEYFASQLGFGIADQMIDQVIVTIPQFQKDGRFDSPTFDLAIGQLGLSRLGFREELRRNLIQYQVRGGIESSAITTRSEILHLLALQNQKRSGRYVIVKAEEFVSDIELSKAEQERYYDENLEQFKSEEAIKVEYVLLSDESFVDQAKIENIDLRAAYEAEVIALSEETERRARHILIAENKNAEELANSVFERIQAGELFANLAKEFSDDIASKNLGGDLGFAPTGTFVPEFEDVLDRLELNEVSKPIKTTYGYHIIELIETRAREIDPFEIRREGLRNQLIEEKTKLLLQDSLEEFSNIAFSGTLEELSSVYGLDVQTSDLILRSGGTDLFAALPIVRKVFDDQLRNGEVNAEVFEVEPGLWMTFRVILYEPKVQKEFAEVQEDVMDLAIAETALEQANLLAENIAKHWRLERNGLPNESLPTILEVDFDGIDRNGSDALDLEALAVVFDSAAPTASPSVTMKAVSNSRFVISQVESIELGQIEEARIGPINSALSQIRESQEGAEFWNFVTTKEEVVQN